ncbi:MAG: hypothetical protein J6W54_02855 [Fibrobacter sp.]|uniref:hypothetical protein n=1 Tax=Fibrobacter sp. TaxID=35828 RepID=UPI001AFE8CE2|nr:hypothetical protein [Fibrobacter sp.]MBO7060025.1 hypothetical protein [Fibrobacter sp.]
MNKKITGMARGLAAATIVAFTLTACSDDSSSVSPVNDTSSIEEQLSSGNDTPAPNGNDTPTSTESKQDSPASSGNDAPAPASSDSASPNSIDAPTSSVNPSADTTHNSNSDVTPTSSSDVVPNSSSDVTPASSNTDTTNFNPENKCPPGGDCNGDGIPDGIYRPDLEPCAVEDSTMEFYNRIFTCKEGKWVYTPDPDDTDPHRETATDAKAEHRGGPAVAPIVVKVKNADGTVTIRDDGADIYDFNAVSVGVELLGDTLVAHVEFPEATTNGFSMGTLTFTLSKTCEGVNYLKYPNRDYAKPIHEVDKLTDCGNNSSCVECPPDQDCGGVAW